MTRKFRSDFVCVMLFCLLIIQASGTLRAQQTPPPVNPPQPLPTAGTDNGPKSESSSKAGTSNGNQALPSPPPFAEKVLFLRNEKGELILVPFGPTLEDYLKFRRDTMAGNSKNTAEWSLSRLTLEGEVKGDLAYLTARVKLKILNAPGTILIPLKFQEATLQDVQHEAGAGDCELRQTTAEQGQLWTFSEAGEHLLKLSLIVKVRKDLPTRRLQLSLPDCPVSELKLKVHFPKIKASTTDERSPLDLSPGPEESTFIQLTGLGPRLDLSWQPLQEQLSAVPSLSVRSGINVIIDGRTVRIEANQRIEVLQGSVTELHVSLPSGMELLKIEGVRYKEHRIESRDNSQVTVLLKEPVSVEESTDLKWTIKGEIPPNLEQVFLQGFNVEQGRFQTGVISVRVMGAYRIQKNDDKDRNIERESLAALERMSNPSIPGQNDPSNIAGVFRFSTQPFHLVLDLKKLEPYISTEPPQYVMHFAGDHVDLEMTSSVQISRGAIDQLTLQWPRWKEDGWRINPSELRKVASNGNPEQRLQLLPDESGSGQIKLQTNDPLEGQYNLRVTAQRPLKGSEEILVTVPSIEGTNQRQETAELITTLADNLDLQVKPAGKTTIRPRDRTNLKSELLARYPELRRMAYQLESYQSGIRAQVNLQTPRLRTESLSTLSIGDGVLNIDQILTYEASYKRISQATLWVPLEWGPQVKYTLLPGTAITGVATNVPEDKGYQQIRLTLEPARMGRFEIRAQAKIPISELIRQETHSLHFIRMFDQAAEVSRLKLQNSAGNEFQLQDPAWTRTANSEGQNLWLAQGEKNAAQISFKLSSDTEVTGGVVQKAWARMAVARDGETYTRAYYRLSGFGNHLRVIFDHKIEMLGIRWNGKLLKRDRWNANAQGYDIQIPAEISENRDQLLTLEYLQTAEITSRLGQSYRLELPTLPVGTRFKEMICEVALPPDTYLWACPATMTPFYRWSMNNFIWSRQSVQTTEELTQWMDLREQTTDAPEHATWNIYRFSRFGAESEIDVSTLRRHLLILFGAGSGLAFTMLLVYLPLMRHVLMFWTASFLVAVLSLWYSEPIVLFVQPVLLGFMLAILSAAVQNLRRRRLIVGTLQARISAAPPSPPISSLQFEPGVSPQGSTAIRAQHAPLSELGGP